MTGLRLALLVIALATPFCARAQDRWTLSERTAVTAECRATYTENGVPAYVVEKFCDCVVDLSQSYARNWDEVMAISSGNGSARQRQQVQGVFKFCAERSVSR